MEFVRCIAARHATPSGPLHEPVVELDSPLLRRTQRLAKHEVTKCRHRQAAPQRHCLDLGRINLHDTRWRGTVVVVVMIAVVMVVVVATDAVVVVVTVVVLVAVLPSILSHLTTLRALQSTSERTTAYDSVRDRNRCLQRCIPKHLVQATAIEAPPTPPPNPFRLETPLPNPTPLLSATPLTLLLYCPLHALDAVSFTHVDLPEKKVPCFWTVPS